MITFKDIINEARKSQKRIKRDAFLYLDPKGNEDKFAQCGTCRMWTGTGCTILGKTKVTAEMSCGLYVHGTPSKDKAGKEESLVTPEEAGLVTRQVRCENCRSFDKKNSVCMLFQSLNKKFPDKFDLEEKVNEYGCCNAQMKK
jgi:hypothetical protein